MRLIIKLRDTRSFKGLQLVREVEHLVEPSEVFLLNEHGDITIGEGRKAHTYPQAEIIDVRYL